MTKIIRTLIVAIAPLVLQISMALGAPIHKGEVPVDSPSDVIFHRGVFWMRDSRGSIFLSVDQGRTWRRRELPQVGGLSPVSIMRPDPASGGIILTTYGSAALVLAQSNELVRCTAMALTYEPGSKPMETHFASAFIVGPNGRDRMGAVGVETEGGKAATLYWSGGCKQVWRSAKSFPAGVFVSFLEWPRARTLIAGNQCRAFLSQDGGAKWVSVRFSPPICRKEVDPERIASIQFFSERRGVLALELGRIYLTTDGGLTWAMQHDAPLPKDMKNFRWPTAHDAGAACFQNESVGWRVSGDSELEMTIDGGKGWQGWGDLGPISRIVGPDSGVCYAIANKQLYLLGR